MSRSLTLPKSRWAWRLAAIALLACGALSLSACKPRNQATTEPSTTLVETGTVQATTTPSVVATETTTTVASSTPLVPSPSASVTVTPPVKPKPVVPAAPVGFWPTKVGLFARSFKSPAWYPKYIPKGFKTESIDVVELDPKTGLVCDVVYLNGDKALQFTQGSPKVRSYAIVSTGKVPWGSGTADVVHQDPADASTPIMIVYSKGGNLAELSGDVSTAQLKAIAASMVVVK